MVERVAVATVRDPRGSLSFVEAGRDIPFDIRRVYYLHDVPYGAQRGGHAHRRLQQAIIAVSGSFVVRTHDGSAWREHLMADPSQALLIPTMTWRELVQFTSGAVCVVLASEHYDASDYVRDFEEFVALMSR